MLNAKNGRLFLKTGAMDYIRFGGGKRTLVMIPGVGDGLKTVKGMALPFAFLYRSLIRDFTVFVMSRRENLPQGMSTREMAEDLNLAMEALALCHACVLGVSQGGMIAQWLALDHPDKVSRLILAVTLCRPNPVVREAVAGWLQMADRGDYKGILLDTAERSYTEKRLRRERFLYRMIGSFGKPQSFDRFRVQAESCVCHDAWNALPRIACPALAIGGTDDRIVTGEASREIAERIPGCALKLYEGLGHGLYEEAPDFLEQVRSFCLAPAGGVVYHPHRDRRERRDTRRLRLGDRPHADPDLREPVRGGRYRERRDHDPPRDHERSTGSGGAGGRRHGSPDRGV